MTEDTVQQFYEEEAKVYDETRFRSSHGAYVDSIQKSTVLELIGNCKGKHVLEIGSGTGRFTRELVKRGAHVVCVDLSSKMHKQARLLLPDGCAEYFIMNGSHLGFADSTFDICLTINMMSHIKNDSKIFTEVNRILKKGGIFVANFPNMSGIYFPIGVVVNLFDRSLQAPVYSRWYTFGSLVRSLKNGGLNPVRFVGRIIFPRTYCPAVLFKCLKKLDHGISNSSMYSLAGNLFIKSHRL